MAAVDDVDELIELYHQALGELVNGNPDPLKESTPIEKTKASLTSSALSCADGMSPRGPWRVPHPTTGTNGEIVGFESVAKYVTSELACIVEMERYRAKVGGVEDIKASCNKVGPDAP
jgi:hypothetical protein